MTAIDEIVADVICELRLRSSL